MLETAETNIKIELCDEDNIEGNYYIWVQQLGHFIEEAKNLVCKAIEVSKLILNSGVCLSSEDEYRTILSYLTTGQKSLDSSINHMKNIQLSSEDQYKIQPTTDYYKPVTKDDNVIEENSELKQIDEKLNLIDNETRTKIEENENIDFDSYSNESDKEAFKDQGIDKEDLELNSKRKPLKRKIRLKDTSKQEEQLEESVKIKSTDTDLSSIKTEPGPKKYNCHKCDYTTNNEEYFNDHINCTLKYKKCHWCDRHVKQDTKRGDRFVIKHIKAAHFGLDGLESEFQCLHCKVKFSDMILLTQHMFNSHGINISYHCPENDCDYSTLISGYIYRHRTSHKQIGDYPCCTCNYIAKTQGALTTHISRNHTEATCPVCNKLFPSQKELSKHEKEEHGIEEKKSYVCCEDCGQMLTVNSIRSHKASQHENKTFPCKHCDFKTTAKHLLRKHWRFWHKNSKPYNCKKCDAAFTSRADFNIHMETVHGGHDFRCDQCSYSTYKNDILSHHIKVHHQRESLLSCTVEGCTSKFARPSALKSHIDRVHDKIEKSGPLLSCPESGCQQTYRNRRNLTIHIEKVHKGVKHPCNDCDFVANYEQYLKCHIDVVHKGILKRCEQCDFTTGLQTKLNVHVLKEHKGVTFPCAECDFVGAIKAKLNQHIRVVHKGLVHKCDLCQYKSPEKRNLLRHKKLVHKIFEDQKVAQEENNQ